MPLFYYKTVYDVLTLPVYYLTTLYSLLLPKNERKEICFVYMQNLKITDKIAIQICYVFTAGVLSAKHTVAPALQVKSNIIT